MLTVELWFGRVKGFSRMVAFVTSLGSVLPPEHGEILELAILAEDLCGKVVDLPGTALWVSLTPLGSLLTSLATCTPLSCSLAVSSFTEELANGFLVIS